MIARIAKIQNAILASCAKVGRNPNDIKIVAISKGFDSSFIEKAAAAEITHIGENYIQEALPKQKKLSHLPLTWHFTGHLQSNKAKKAAMHFNLIHSVDSFALARELEDISQQLGKPVSILFELKTHSENAYGFTPETMEREAPLLKKFSGLKPLGIMTLAPHAGEITQIRASFRKAREVLSLLKDFFSPEFKELSMGMSEDFQIAVEEGATLLRIGRAIFGERGKTNRGENP